MSGATQCVHWSPLGAPGPRVRRLDDAGGPACADWPHRSVQDPEQDVSRHTMCTLVSGHPPVLLGPDQADHLPPEAVLLRPGGPGPAGHLHPLWPAWIQ